MAFTFTLAQWHCLQLVMNSPSGTICLWSVGKGSSPPVINYMIIDIDYQFLIFDNRFFLIDDPTEVQLAIEKFSCKLHYGFGPSKFYSLTFSKQNSVREFVDKSQCICLQGITQMDLLTSHTSGQTLASRSPSLSLPKPCA